MLEKVFIYLFFFFNFFLDLSEKNLIYITHSKSARSINQSPKNIYTFICKLLIEFDNKITQINKITVTIPQIKFGYFLIINHNS